MPKCIWSNILSLKVCQMYYSKRETKNSKKSSVAKGLNFVNIKKAPKRVQIFTHTNTSNWIYFPRVILWKIQFWLFAVLFTSICLMRCNNIDFPRRRNKREKCHDFHIIFSCEIRIFLSTTRKGLDFVISMYTATIMMINSYRNDSLDTITFIIIILIIILHKKDLQR